MDESRLKQILDANPDMFMIIDGNGILVDFKPSINFEPILAPEDFLGRSIGEVLPDEIARQCMARVREVQETGTEGFMEYNLPVDSNPQYYEARFTPFDEKHVLAVIRDVTDRRQSLEAAQALINASKARHDRLFDENPVPMYIYDTQTLNILDANTSLIESYGYAREELITMNIGDIRPAEDVSLVMENVTDLTTRQVYLGRWRHTKKDGTVIDVDITSADFPYEDKPARLVLCMDVTEKVVMQKALEEREEEYRYLFEQNPLPMMIIDPISMDVLNVNNAAVDHYGYGKGEFLSMTIGDFRPAEDIRLAEKTIRSLSTPQEKVGVHRHLKKNGTVILVDIVSHEVTYEGRKARLVLCNDVTDQIHAREALEESEAKFRSVVESSPMGLHMYSLDELDRLIFAGANPVADVILGIDHSQLTGLTLEEAFPGSGSTEIPNRYREVCLSGRPWHSEQVNYQDEQINGAFEVHAFQTGQRSMSVLFLDITEKKRVEEAIAESEEKFRKAFLTSPDPMTISKLEDGSLLEVNDGFIKGTGYSREESLGKTTFDLELWTAEGQREEMVNKLQQEGRLENFELTIKTKDGSIRHALLSASIIRVGNIPRMFTITRDITDLKTVEEALLQSQEQLRASLGEKEILLKEIHHRVKNNLQVISGLLDLQAHHIADPMGREIYKESQNRVITMALIHEELYRSINLSQVDFSDYIQNLCKNLMISYGVDRNRIKLEIDAEKTEMIVDTAIPCGLIINELITNSLKHAFPGKRKGTISLSFRQMRNKNFLLTVSDDGVGLPRDVDLSSTNTLGIQLVTVLVAQLDGTLKITRREGTSFTIKFKEYHEAGSVMY